MNTQDPHYTRETKKYAKPIASREFLLDIIGQNKKSISLRKIAQSVNIATDDEQQITALQRRLKAMINDGQIQYDGKGYTLLPLSKHKIGRVLGNKNGQGYFIPDDGSDQLLIHEKQMRCVFDGDTVVATERTYNNKEPEAAIIKVLKRNSLSHIGHLHFSKNNEAYVVPSNKRNKLTINVIGDTRQAKSGDLVQIDIDKQPSKRERPTGYIRNIFRGTRKDEEINISLINHRLRHEWPKATLKEAEAISQTIDQATMNKRFDIRKLPFVTIDGTDSKDFDDAVYCEKQGRYYKLLVAIADVSEYVQPQSQLDIEAQLRGNSVYFPTEVIPMLPERLSNEICSLNPHQERLVLVCEMRITAAGNIHDYLFYEACFQSHARLTYDQVTAILNNSEKPKLDPQVYQNIQMLEQVYQCFMRRRQKRGALTIELPEFRFMFTDGAITGITKDYRTLAHKIIEEAMLAANESAALLLSTHKIPALYRTHDSPNTEKIKELRHYLNYSRLRLTGGNNPQPKDFTKLIDRILQHPTEHNDILYSQLLRTMAKAEYKPELTGHYGLAYSHYTHFTSPIRRYPDLLVHRAIRSLIHSRNPTDVCKRAKKSDIWQKAHSYPYTKKQLHLLGKYCTDTEIRAEEASRDVHRYMRCRYLQTRLGESFTGVIKAVTSFGAFVEMEGTHCEGLLHISALKGDYYQYHKESMTLTGKKTGHQFTLGKKLTVKLARVDLEQSMVDLELIDKTISTKKAQSRFS